MKSTDIREQFLSFFEKKGHTRVASGPLVPGNDPSLLFTNSGMVQFKDIFLGRENIPSNPRAASSQCCVRAGGKHNDLENVGYTTRHHTFFEMLGNFSFGDYFKHEAINYAWELVTQVFDIPGERLWITVFEEDKEAADIWLNEIGIHPTRLLRIGAKDNFWSMGDIGPCGPCTEIFYDHGDKVAGGLPGTADAEGDRFVEIWNLVFMQYDRARDGTLTALPKPSVDTGMGLERISAIMQGVHNNYETDLFHGLIQYTADLAKTNDLSQSSLCVIADHIRTCSFLIIDGVTPSNEDRGYVLRRIIRRAVRHGHKLGLRDTFFHKLVAPLEAVMGKAYPKLVQSTSRIRSILQREEERFAITLDTGLAILEDELSKTSAKKIPGSLIFKLYDTYGFPEDLTSDIAREGGFEFDRQGFDTLMSEQKNRSRVASSFEMQQDTVAQADTLTTFTGYDTLDDSGVVQHLFVDSNEVDALAAGDEAIVILDNTPFYAEAGGQIGDTGMLIKWVDNDAVKFEVKDTQKQGDTHKHIGLLLNGSLQIGDTVNTQVDVERRTKIMLNHSATHLLHATLRKVLGEEVYQKGSLVSDTRLRFDFSYSESVSVDNLYKIEALVNEQIRQNIPVKAEVLEQKQALQKGALALFGEKYGNEVRVLSIGDCSMEFCGGTHVQYTGDIALFKVICESGVASGIRRIEAVTGQIAYDYVTIKERQFRELATQIKTNENNLIDKVMQLFEENKKLAKELATCKEKILSTVGDDLSKQVVVVNGVKVLAAKLDGVDRKSLRIATDKMKAQLGDTAAVVFASSKGDKVQLVASVTENCTGWLNASSLVNMVAEQVGGKGGGRRADMAEAGGTNPAALDVALASVPDWIRSQIT